MRCTIMDRDAVNSVLSADSTYIPINGKACEDKENLADALLLDSNSHVLMPEYGFIGIFILQNKGLYSGHVASLPEVRGKKAVRLGKKCLKWIFDNTECIKIFGLTPICWKHAIVFNKLIGFKKIGVLEDSIIINGEKVSQVIFST